MRVIIVYGTVEGQTRRIARSMASTVQEAGAHVTVFDMDDLQDVELDRSDRVIVAAPVHAGEYPDEIVDWVKANSARLNALPSAFVSVSLSAASSFPEEHEAIAKITMDFLAATGWHPRAVHQAAGALRYSEYDFLKKLLMRYIARKEGASTDTSRDFEFTDWAKLGAFVGDFLKSA